MGGKFSEGSEYRLLGLLCANDLVLCWEQEEDLGVKLKHFTNVCIGRSLKVNAKKSKMIELAREE